MHLEYAKSILLLNQVKIGEKQVLPFLEILLIQYYI